MVGGVLQTLKNLWAQKGSVHLDKIDWQELFQSPYFIGLAVIVLALALYKGMYKFLVLVLCGGAFYFVWNHIMDKNKDMLTPNNIFSFVGLSVLIIGIVIYFYFIRSD